jgi:flagellar protein FliO/FliZ
MKKLLSTLFLMVSLTAHAAEPVSASGGIMKMVLGLATVLAVMALIAWVLKRVLPSVGGNNQSAIRVVGAVNVGSRERVVVVEVAGRWIVVGVASGQVNGLANLEPGTPQLEANVLKQNVVNNPLEGMGQLTQTFAPSFAQLLKKSAAKFTENSNEK